MSCAEDKLALFVVTRGTVQAFTLPLTYKSLASKASAFRVACADPRKDYKTAAAELYKTLIAPAQKHLAGAKRLVIALSTRRIALSTRRIVAWVRQ